MSSSNVETRGKILKAAWKLLEAEPGKSVRMSDIAKEAGISRQAVYLHFATRAELLVATARYLDEVNNVDEGLAASRTASTGVERLNAFIEAWGNYIPKIHGIAKAFLAMQDTDNAAAIAWNDRMQAVREGCEAAIKALKKDGTLTSDYSTNQATDILWTMLSVRNWEQLTGGCGWPQKRYVDTMKLLARRTLVAE
ncbi:MAG: TetR/AcrR family transcriptional regulator [Proteobacteria bacterium]|nr:TetR/AcrR family transcriptional regulator [Pseudomonadota bacterium]MDA1357266.1 TetR/AcrR family transcriptional regulator [Pseudomonadota bacterium]